MKKILSWCAALAVVTLLAGCARTAPVEQIHTTLHAGYTDQQVRTAIVNAGVKRNWVMTQVAPNVIKARQQARDHMAEVMIAWSNTQYDITYSSSRNLMASGNQIHSAYNRWVHNLDHDIQVQLAADAIR